MKGICEVTYVFAAFKNKEGVLITKYAFKDPEGYSGEAYAPLSEGLEKGDNCLVSMRNYKGKWYAKHLEKVE